MIAMKGKNCVAIASDTRYGIQVSRTLSISLSLFHRRAILFTML